MFIPGIKFNYERAGHAVPAMMSTAKVSVSGTEKNKNSYCSKVEEFNRILLIRSVRQTAPGPKGLLCRRPYEGPPPHRDGGEWENMGGGVKSVINSSVP